MIDPKKLEEIAKQIHNALPPGIRSMGEEVEKKTRQVLQAQLGRLDLVSREEFDVQTNVLLLTREKLAALEAKLAPDPGRGRDLGRVVHAQGRRQPRFARPEGRKLILTKGDDRHAQRFQKLKRLGQVQNRLGAGCDHGDRGAGQLIEVG